MGAGLIAKLAGFLGLDKISQVWLDIAALALVGLGVFLFYHHAFENGKRAEIAALQRAADKATKALQVKADEAGHSHDAEIADLRAYRDAHPPGAVRLCVSTTAPVRPAASAGTSADSAAPAAGSLQSVPTGDSGSGAGRAGPDIGPMLEALAGAADRLSAQVRGLQAVQR